jgi:hypothetical protein
MGVGGDLHLSHRRGPAHFFASATDGAIFRGGRSAVSNGRYDFSSVISSANSASTAACNITR